MNRIAIEVGSEPLVMQLSGEVELTITAKPVTSRPFYMRATGVESMSRDDFDAKWSGALSHGFISK